MVRLFVALFLLAAASISSLSAAPPNVVLIISDDQAWTEYGFAGHPTVKTPHLDKLAAESATFSRGYVPIALCRPSLASIVTGLYPHQHAIVGNDPFPRQNPELREKLISQIDQFDTLPELLAEKGYRSHQSGKWWEGNFKRGGFTHGMTRGFPEKGGRHGDDGLKIGRDGMEPVTEFIDESIAEKKPFFVWYAPFLPHTPHNPPDRILKKYTSGNLPLPLAKYYAMCEWFDETCGQLMDHLEERKIADETLVIYVTDNGWIQRLQGRGQMFAPRSKQSPYEAGVRTPIMFRWPGVVKPGMRAELCTSLDIMPTVLAAADAQTPADLPGINLLPQLTSGDAIERNTIFGESFGHDVPDIGNPESALVYRWVIDGNWKLLLTYDVAETHVFYKPQDYRPQLYDLDKDPHETNNLAGKNQQVVERLAKKLDAEWTLKTRKAITKWSASPVSQAEAMELGEQ